MSPPPSRRKLERVADVRPTLRAEPGSVTIRSERMPTYDRQDSYGVPPSPHRSGVGLLKWRTEFLGGKVAANRKSEARVRELCACYSGSGDSSSANVYAKIRRDMDTEISAEYRSH